jgi:hypothetical protein
MRMMRFATLQTVTLAGCLGGRIFLLERLVVSIGNLVTWVPMTANHSNSLSFQQPDCFLCYTQSDGTKQKFVLSEVAKIFNFLE